jgi:hypothetical protein
VEENMVSGLYVQQDGLIMVAYGRRQIAISRAQYKANGYKPVLEQLVAKSPRADEPQRHSAARPSKPKAAHS